MAAYKLPDWVPSPAMGGLTPLPQGHLEDGGCHMVSVLHYSTMSTVAGDHTITTGKPSESCTGGTTHAKGSHQGEKWLSDTESGEIQVSPHLCGALESGVGSSYECAPVHSRRTELLHQQLKAIRVSAQQSCRCQGQTAVSVTAHILTRSAIAATLLLPSFYGGEVVQSS